MAQVVFEVVLVVAHVVTQMQMAEKVARVVSQVAQVVTHRV